MRRMPNARFVGKVLTILLIVAVVFVAHGQTHIASKPAARSKVRAAVEKVRTPTPEATSLPATPAPTPIATPTPAPMPESTPVATPPPITPPPALPTPAPIPQATPAPVAPPAPSAGQNLVLAQTLVDMVNQKRAQNGLGSVSLNADLTAAAQQYSDLQFQTNPYALNHYLDGSPGDRALKVGYTGGVGEVLVTSPPSAPQILDLWLTSPPHAEILMGPAFEEIGMGCHQGHYAVDGTVFEIASCAGELGIP